MGFFVGASPDGVCGAGLVIKLDNHKMSKGRLKAGIGTNTRAEVIGLWSLLFCAKFWGLKHLQVLGDSQVIINWALGKAQMKSMEFNHWLDNIKILMNEFTWLSFNHVYS